MVINSLRPSHFTLNCRGTCLDLSRPVVMGILNITPDSFFDGGRWRERDTILRHCQKMLEEGAAIIDIGGVSTRPNAATVSESDELQRILSVLEWIVQAFPQAIISIDTWRGRVAEEALQRGAHIINDISGGNMDAGLWDVVARWQVPYILMHIQGTPQTMQQNPHYEDIVADVWDFLIQKTAQLHARNIREIILDVGFGFGKTIAHNYTLLRQMDVFRTLGYPLLAGISRKSMIWKPLGITPQEALSGTSALHMVALQQGASILRAHDVREANEVIRLWELLNQD